MSTRLASSIDRLSALIDASDPAERVRMLRLARRYADAFADRIAPDRSPSGEEAWDRVVRAGSVPLVEACLRRWFPGESRWNRFVSLNVSMKVGRHAVGRLMPWWALGIRHPDPALHQVAAMALGSVRSRRHRVQARDLLLEALESCGPPSTERDTFRARCVQSLWLCGGGAKVARRLALLRDDPDEDVRRYVAMFESGWYGDRRARVARFLATGVVADGHERLAASFASFASVASEEDVVRLVEVVARSGAGVLLGGLLDAVSTHPAPATRLAAVSAAARRAKEPGRRSDLCSPLLRATHDPEPWVRAAATRALRWFVRGRCRGEVLLRLAELTDPDEPDVVRAAVLEVDGVARGFTIPPVRSPLE